MLYKVLPCIVYRLLMVAGLYPLLVRTGYAINWKSMLVITWSGLRGAVSLALALVVEQTPEIPTDTIGNKVNKANYSMKPGFYHS